MAMSLGQLTVLLVGIARAASIPSHQKISTNSHILYVVALNQTNATIPYGTTVEIPCHFDKDVRCRWNKQNLPMFISASGCNDHYTYKTGRGMHTTDCSIIIRAFEWGDGGEWQCESMGDDFSYAIKKPAVTLNTRENSTSSATTTATTNDGPKTTGDEAEPISANNLTTQDVGPKLSEVVAAAGADATTMQAIYGSAIAVGIALIALFLVIIFYQIKLQAVAATTPYHSVGQRDSGVSFPQIVTENQPQIQANHRLTPLQLPSVCEIIYEEIPEKRDSSYYTV